MQQQNVWIFSLCYRLAFVGLCFVGSLGLSVACVSPVSTEQTVSTEPSTSTESTQEQVSLEDATSTEPDHVPETTVIPEGAGLSVLPPAQTRTYPLDDVLRLNHIQVKGTHNSYHIAPKAGVKDWMYTHDPLDVQLEQQGIRQFELDIYWDADRKVFVVYHLPLVDQATTCDTWKDCLGVLKYWSDRRPQHLPIVVMVETKLSETNEPPQMLETLEQETLQVFPKERIITPDSVQGNANTLREAVQTKGWPTLREVRGKILFFLLMSDTRIQSYTSGKKHLRGRLFFVNDTVGEPYMVVGKIDDPQGSETKIQETIRKGILIRTRADSDLDASKQTNETRLQSALKSGAHLLSSDHPKPRSDGYKVDIPGGTPARCNPITAPVSCTSQALEQIP